MSRRSLSAAVVALVSLALCAPASADSRHPINAYRVKATAKNLKSLALAGFDVTEGRRKDGTVEVYGAARQFEKLNLGAKIVRDRFGRTTAARSRSLAPPADPVTYSGSDAEWNVWTRFDRVAGDSKEQYQEQYDRLSGLGIVKKEVLGTTYLGRDIVALKVTKDAKTERDGTRPAVLYNALQHAREWLAGETCRRTLEYVTSNYGQNTDAGHTVTPLVDSRELWFVCVTNPDGYEYTFTQGNRLWRKNMADNDNDGVRGELGDGVDPNRNFATNWGRDDEGSSPVPTSETYRGPKGDSEPETKAFKGLEARVHFAFIKNDHTAAELLLWPYGFQQYTHTPDEGIFAALAGDDATPAIADFAEDADGNLTVTGNRFDPDLSSELYITNGDELDDAYHQFGVLGFTPEGTAATDPNVSGFEFPDDEAQIQAEFLRHRRFALDLAKSAADPANPDSFLGNTTNDFYVDSFATSWGDPQPVQVTAKRALGAIKVRYRINDGRVRTAGTSEWGGGEDYGRDRGVYYHRLRGMVTGTSPGDDVDVWFEQVHGNRHSSHFHYRAVREDNASVLIMSAEDYTGPSPAQDTSGPHYLSFYTDALDALNIDYDVYDVDRRDRTSPDPLGVLSHYDAVIWYTGDDFVTREPYQVPGTGTSRLALDEQIDVRDYLNEGGKLFYTGQFAGEEYSDGFEVKNYGFEQSPTSMCSPDLPEFDPDDPTAADGCITHVDDFLQYYLGAYRYVAGGNSTDEEGNLLPIAGIADPFRGLRLTFDDTGAGNQANSATFVVTSSVLNPQKYPLFKDSKALAGWVRPGAAPFNPFAGSFYMAAGATDAAYKRLHRTIDLTGVTAAQTPQLSFMTSYDLEPDYDYMFVEAHTVGQDDWTTLPDVGGGTSNDTGLSCFSGGVGSDWQSLHPFLTHYQTKTGSESCSPTGTSGAWNAATASSGGWVPWTVDLGPYAGKQVEVSITVATDPATLGLGAWVDEAKLVVGGQTLESEGFETGTGPWVVGPPPAGTVNTESGWARAQESFKEGGVVGTDDTVYTGFGFEGVNEASRVPFMRAVMRYLGVRGRSPHSSPPPHPAAPGPKPARLARKALDASRKGKVKVKVSCTGTGMCRGVLRIYRNGKRLGSKAFAIPGGTSRSVTVKLSRSARRMLAKHRSMKVRISVTGTDGAGSSIAASQRVKLKR